jgi:carbonic anhydrase
MRILSVVLAATAITVAPSFSQVGCSQCPNLAPANAWAELEAGNARFLSGKLKPRADACRLACTKDSQKPFGVILTCADSRVPPELAFDERIGDLFVVRVAGNAASDEAIGSIEYAIEHLKSPKIIVVLGHEKCGAVSAALAHQPESDLVPSILTRILPALKDIPDGPPTAARLTDAIQRNVRYNAKLLDTQSKVIHHAVTEGHLPIQGAYYSISTGKVTKVNP